MSQRYHGLDALRGGAMLLGLVLHACQLFLTPDLMTDVLPNATVTPPDPTFTTQLLVTWIHNWRMPLFFILAGFFAAMVLERRGWRSFWTDRAQRIFGALVVFHLLFVLTLDRPLGALDHLWFLWTLTFLCLMAPAIPAHRTVGWITHPKHLIWLIIPVTVSGLLGRSGLWHIRPITLPDITWQALALYGTFFVIGQILWHNKAILDKLAVPRLAVALLAIGSLLTVTIMFMSNAAFSNVFLQAIIAASTLLWCFGLIGLTHWALTRPRKWLSTLVDLSYPIYIFHLYPVMLFAALAIEFGAPQGIVVILGVFGGLLTALLCTVLLIRYTPLNWCLAGYSKSWFKQPFDKNGWPETQKAAP